LANYVKNLGAFKTRLLEAKKKLVFRNFISFIAKRAPPKSTILDVGFGSGVLLKELITNFPESNVFGIDVNETYFNHVKANIPQAKLEIYDGLKIPFQPNTFDVVTCIQVVEHMTDPELFFKEAFTVLKPGGIAIVTTPNPDGLAAKILGNRWQGIDPEEHIALNSPATWKKFAFDNGFDVTNEGTTLLSGFKVFRMFPLSLLSGLILVMFGQFKWKYGESYHLFLKKP